jgi:hypothetical protein
MNGAYGTRPANFTGFSGVVTDALTTALTATDWNAFIGRLIQFAVYKGKGNEIGSYTDVYSNDYLTASIYNEPVLGLNVLSPYITESIPASRTQGEDVYASYIQALKTALNSIT